MEAVVRPPLRKRVLLLRYSQSGQLAALMDHFTAPLRADPAIELVTLDLVPARPFPFPWSFFAFLDAFPESAHLAPAPLAPLALQGDEAFDLVLLPWQVWFLAPSQPVTAFLQHPVAQRVLAGRPVVSVVACRNMWMAAFDTLRTLLDEAGARLVDHVAYTDPSPTLATFITTPRWMLTGRRDGFWGLPPAGLDTAQLQGAARFGTALRDALSRDEERGAGPLLAGLGAVQADPHLYFSERTGTRSFAVWGRLLRAVGPPGSARRRPVLLLYVAFLVAAIVTLVPTSLLLQRLARPLLRRRLDNLRLHYEQPSGSARKRGLPSE